MKKYYYMVNVCIHDGYSFMVRTEEVVKNDIKTMCLEQDLFQDANDVFSAEVVEWDDADDIEHFKKCFALFDLDD